jgi:hypothetical protein
MTWKAAGTDSMISYDVLFPRSALLPVPLVRSSAYVPLLNVSFTPLVISPGVTVENVALEATEGYGRR